MKILIVSQYFWPESFQINDVAKALKKKYSKISIDVLTGKPNYPDGVIFDGYSTFGKVREQWEKIKIYRVPLVARGNKSTLRLIANYFSFLFFGVLFSPWLLRKKQYDVIFIYGVSPILQALVAIFLAKIKRCPNVLWVQDLWPESLEATGYVKNKYITNIVTALVRWIYRHSDLILVQSHAFLAPVKLMASETPVVYYPNTVDASFTKPPEIQTENIPALEKGFSVLFAGNIGTVQAVEHIVEAAVLLKDYYDINFIVVGSGSRLAWMENEVKKRKLENLHLPGRFPVDTMPSFMQKASVLLVSLTDKAIFSLTVPNKIQAYMASGRPILAFLNGEGARVVTEAKAGISIPAENTQALVDGILKLYKMTDFERSVLGENGKKYFEKNYESNFLLEQLIEHFEFSSIIHSNKKYK